MEFINIPTSLFSSPEYIGAEPVQRATWISLLAWCCEQENDGVIEDCRSWGMRRWMQTCGATDQEINVENELYHFDGDNLIVFGYPHEIQETLKTKRKTARENGRLGGRPKKTNVETNIGTNVETEEKPTLVSEKTYVGTEIGTNVGSNIETDIATYQKTVREGKEGKEGIHPLTPSPCTVEEVEAHLRAAAFTGRVRLAPDQIPDCATAYISKRDLTDWKRGEIPITVAKWKSDSINFAVSYSANHPAQPVTDKDPYSHLDEL